MDQSAPDFYLSVNFPRAIGGRFFSSREDYVKYLATLETDPATETEKGAVPEADERKALIQTLKAAGQTVGGNTSITKLREMAANLEA